MEEWLTIREAAEKYGYSSEYLRRLAREGKIISRKRGWSYEVERRDLERYVREVRDKDGE